MPEYNTYSITLLQCISYYDLPDVDHLIYIPKTNDLLMPSLEVVPMQLLGYYIALARKCDIDKPRNLAKSVTVE